MRRPRAPGLRARLVLALFATAAATLAVAALALLPPLEQRLREDAARTLTLRAEAARAGFERLHLRDAAHTHRLLSELARATGAQVSLISVAGVVARTDPDEPGGFGDALTAIRTGRNGRSVHGGIALAAIPVRIGGRQYALALRRPLGDVGRTYTVVETAFAGAAVVGLLLALIGGLALSGRMLRRLRALSHAMRAAEPALAPAEVDMHPDELGELARAFAGLQQRLAQQEDARRTFVATASHELRTPLASLQSLLELAADEVADDAPDLEAVRADVIEALAQARRLSGLSAGLLDLSRLDAGKGLRSEPVELGELSRAVAAEFRTRGNPRWIAPAEACWALGDPDGVARIVRLLVDNALRHTPDPAAVEVRVEAVNGHAAVRVLDAGPGVSAGERDAIFERFQRGERTTAPGFGLGLAIGAELARRMAGELTLEAGDPAPGEPPGARFTLRLPAYSTT
jgi:signal transduction histidine kinase